MNREQRRKARCEMVSSTRGFVEAIAAMRDANPGRERTAREADVLDAARRLEGAFGHGDEPALRGIPHLDTHFDAILDRFHRVMFAWHMLLTTPTPDGGRQHHVRSPPYGSLSGYFNPSDPYNLTSHICDNIDIIRRSLEAVDRLFRPNAAQSRALRKLDRVAMTLDQLVVEAAVERRQLLRELNELRAYARVVNRRGIGYYRPDAPPPGLDP